MKKKINIIISNILYSIFKSKYKVIIPKFIREQYEFRINYIDRICYYKKECRFDNKSKIPNSQLLCGTCKGNCYPKLVNKKEWEKFKKGYYFLFTDIDKDTYYEYYLRGRANKVDLHINKYYKNKLIREESIVRYEDKRI